MPRRTGFLLALLLLAVAPPALAEGGARIVELDSSPIALLSPSPGEALVAGSWIELAWEPIAPDLEAEEWELFLSVDGGRSFAVRLTPHLDFAVRRLAVEIPRLPSDDVRLLFRLGDEREERAVRVAARFAIRDGAAVADSSVVRRDLPGEAALEGEAGVALWSEGARDGSRRARHEAAFQAKLSSSAPAIAAGEDLALRGEENDPETLLALAPRAERSSSRRARRASRHPRRAPARPVDLLTLLRRQNE